VNYAQHMRRLRDRQRADFALLNEEQVREQWQRRQAWLWQRFLGLLGQHINIVVACPVCSGVQLKPRSWPSFYECACGANVILDRWLPDDVERVATMSTQALARFAETHPRAIDLFDYPLEERLRDLSWEFD
jgi:hypothetical protein